MEQHETMLRDGLILTVRSGVESDKDALRAYYHQLASDDGAAFFSMPSNEREIDSWLHYAGILSFSANIHIIALDRNILIGDLFLRRVDKPSIGLTGIAETYLTLHREYRLRGVGSYMLGLLSTRLREWLENHGIRRLVAHIYHENDHSMAIAIKAGFTIEGTLRQHLQGRDGKYHDVVTLGHLLSVVDECSVCRLSRENLTYPE